MVACRTLGLLVVSALGTVAGGCTNTEGGDQPDAPPALQYEVFSGMTWSISATGGQYQLSITDATGTAACNLSQDHRNGLGAAGHQLIIHITDDVSAPCPQGNFTLTPDCSTDLGAGTSVPATCGYYRRFDAQGATVGIVAARNGVITVSGTASSCTVRANVGFLGGSFSEFETLVDGATAQPWCN